jgi:predicted nucleotidyltransferase
MISRGTIRKFTDEVARRFKPRKIILFGSYAYGKPSDHSDVDLLVVMPYDRRKGRMSLKIRQAMDYDFPLDLLVRTPAELRQRLQWGDCFIQEILSNEKVLYEGAHARVGKKS